MGDTLWGTPAIRAIKKSLPNVYIDLLLQPQWKPLFYGNKNLRRLISYRPQWYRQFFLLPSLCSTRYDHIFIFHANSNIGRILPWLRTSSIWSHQYPDVIPGVSENKIIHFDKPTHGILRRIAMLERLHISPDGTNMEIFLNYEEKENASSFLRDHNIKSKEFIYLNIGGSVPYKQWPIKNFILLSKTILQKTSLSIVLGGGPEDESRVEDISRQLNSSYVVGASHHSIRKSCSLISQAKMLISPDSGPMHIGYALKVPTIGLFWLANSDATQRNVLNGPEYCGPLNIDKSLSSVISGCFKETFEKDNVNSVVFKTISVEDVWDKITEFL